MTEISRELGISRQTIYRWINEGELDRDLEEVRYGPRPPVPTKLDPYKAIVRERLEEYPELTAVRLLAEIRAAGHPGGYTQPREYVRKVRPRAPADPLVRFETDPGVQGQVDFAHFRFPWGRRYLLLVVLGYSRLLWLRFYPRQDMPTLLKGLEAAFGFFGGVPRDLLFDQMKSVIVRDLRGEGGRVTENAEFLRFAAHWGFRPRGCLPGEGEGEGRAPHRLRSQELHLRSQLRRRRGPERAGRVVARERGQGPDPRHHARAARRTVRTRRAPCAQAARSQALPLARAARRAGGRDGSPARLGAPGHHRTASPGRVRPPRRGGLVRPAKRPGRRDPIRAQLADLKLPRALEALDPILSGVDGGRFTAAEAIEKLLAAQIDLRNNRRLQAAMRASRLPTVKDPGQLRLQLPALEQARADRLPARTLLPRPQGERRLPRAHRSSDILHHLSM